MLLFLFSLGHALEHLALDRANQSIAQLARLVPKTALIKRGAEMVELALDDIAVGDIAVIKPHTRIAADGQVLNGESMVDQSSLTGESMPVLKRPVRENDSKPASEIVAEMNRVYAGTTNGSGYLEVLVQKPASESSLSRLVRMVQEAKENKSYAQKITYTFEKIYVPGVLIFVILLHFSFLLIDEHFSDSFYRAITFLVVASPCALVISTPSAVLCGIARAAKSGVLFKGGRPLIELSLVNAIIFDKTGTLTSGQPVVTDFLPFDTGDVSDLMASIVALEDKSDHPLARSIADELRKKLNSKSIPEVRDFHSVTGCGVRGLIDGQLFQVGNTELFAGQECGTIPDHVIRLKSTMETEGKTTVLVMRQTEFKALIGIMDVPRKENIRVIQKLRELGIERLLMLSGDHQLVSAAVGRRLGLTEIYGGMQPEDKLRKVSELTLARYKVAMVGDGINDAPALAGSAVGVAMGAAGSEVAQESADVALMANQLEQLPFAIQLSRRTRKIVRQNLLISIGVIIFMVPLALLGLTGIGPAVLIHEGSTVAVVLNALRLLR